MEKFTRAVTEEQKLIRRNEIKLAAEKELSLHPTFELSMTSVAKSLNWTRSNLYKFYASVNEVIGDIWADKFTSLCREFN
ncbi:MAG: hypothetical protein MJZ21_03580, partial [archaeon]|nr:hypothetical protein [archaeon]